MVHRRRIRMMKSAKTQTLNQRRKDDAHSSNFKMSPTRMKTNQEAVLQENEVLYKMLTKALMAKESMQKANTWLRNEVERLKKQFKPSSEQDYKSKGQKLSWEPDPKTNNFKVDSLGIEDVLPNCNAAGIQQKVIQRGIAQFEIEDVQGNCDPKFTEKFRDVPAWTKVKKNPYRKCKFCKEKHKLGTAHCSAYGYRCSKCNEVNHNEKACWNKRNAFSSMRSYAKVIKEISESDKKADKQVCKDEYSEFIIGAIQVEEKMKPINTQKPAEKVSQYRNVLGGIQVEDRIESFKNDN